MPSISFTSVSDNPINSSSDRTVERITYFGDPPEATWLLSAVISTPSYFTNRVPFQ